MNKIQNSKNDEIFPQKVIEQIKYDPELLVNAINNLSRSALQVSKQMEECTKSIKTLQSVIKNKK